MHRENYKQHIHINTLCGENDNFLNVTPNGGVRGEPGSTNIRLQEVVHILTT
jgi:hypothetical protein